MFKHFAVLIVFVFLNFSGWSHADSSRTKAAIATAHPLATFAGFEILDQGGNVFDAAVAVSAALAVLEPSGSGLGGGGFWLLHRASDGFEVMLDGREKAPLAAHAKMFQDANGQLQKKLVLESALSAAIPGMPAALVHLSEHYGRLPLATSLAPAIRYAKAGFKVSARYLKLLKYRSDVIKKNPAASAIFLENGELPKEHSLLKQDDLANTLEAIADNGRAGFYNGDVAEKLLQSVNAGGGIWTQADLDAYRVIERAPVKGVYRGIKITSAAPPSSGGVVLLEALNILSAYDLNALPPLTSKHLQIEAMRHAYHDRALYLGDPDFIKIPLQKLLSQDYAAQQRQQIKTDATLPIEAFPGVIHDQAGGVDTTHFSIIDAEGNRVAATMSINFPFGSGIVAEGTGVLLNDEMDDFVSKEGDPNGYGLVGGVANTIAPGKRMLSSMTPTFLEDNDRVAVLGTPGGSRIISMVLLSVLDFAKGHTPQSWVQLPRFHHQFVPDVVQYENQALTSEEIAQLTLLGHETKPARYAYGNMQAVQLSKSNQTLAAASDPRGEGFAKVRE